MKNWKVIFTLKKGDVTHKWDTIIKAKASYPSIWQDAIIQIVKFNPGIQALLNEATWETVEDKPYSAIMQDIEDNFINALSETEKHELYILQTLQGLTAGMLMIGKALPEESALKPVFLRDLIGVQRAITLEIVANINGERINKKDFPSPTDDFIN